MLDPGKIQNVISGLDLTLAETHLGITQTGKNEPWYTISKATFLPKKGDVFLVCILATIATPDKKYD